jgi:hypothetical protein
MLALGIGDWRLGIGVHQVRLGGERPGTQNPANREQLHGGLCRTPGRTRLAKRRFAPAGGVPPSRQLPIARRPAPSGSARG